MQARDVMSDTVATVRLDTPVAEIARLLLERGISAVPVVDESGAPIGMVSEGDLVGRSEEEREERRDWWLTLLAEGEALNPDFLASLRRAQRTARDIMSAPVITVNEATDTREVARLLADYRIKRVPVVHDGRIVGIVSRADLVRVLAAEQREPAAPEHGGFFSAALASIDHPFEAGRQSAAAPARAKIRAVSEEPGLTVGDFRGLVADFERQQAHQRNETLRAAADRRRQRVEALIERHIAEDGWRALLHQAREAAEHGEEEFMLLRFPSELCSDGGRAINAPLRDWPATLRGEAAEIYLRWARDLKPHGFHLTARVLDFPRGFPGDIGLFLVWGE